MTSPYKVCRLCLSTEDLLWVFGDNMENNIKEVIHVTSGVEINKTDTITQMVCNTCCQITLKMYKFRTTSMKNDKELKSKCGVKNTIRPLSTSATTNTEKVPRPKSVAPDFLPFPVFKNHDKAPRPKSVASDKDKTPSLPAKYRHAHPSIKEVVLKVPNIRLPDEALKLHVGAYITLLKDEVDDWFMEHNYTEKEIEKIKREAYELANESDEQKKRKRCQTDAERKTPISTPEGWKRRRMSVDSSCSESTTNSEVSALFHHTELSKKSVKTNKLPTLPTNLKLDIKYVRDRLNDFVKSDIASKVVPQKSDKCDNDLSNKIIGVQRGDVIEKSILNKLLTQQEFPAKKNENITLKSILDSNGISKNKPEYDEVIVIDPPSPPPKHHSKEETKSTSTEERAEPNVIKTTTTSTSTEEETLVFILSDSDDGGADTNNINEDTTDNDSIVFNIDTPSSPSSSNSGTSKEKATDKTTFTEALQLAPKPSTASNMPDLSLVSLANRRTYPLYTCKVCDSQHGSLKDLKHHQRRTHTRCPFCTKRFRSLAHRDEHVKTNCLVSTSSVKLKKLRLQLVRVEEIEEIRKKYPKAFENEDNASNFSESNLDVEVTSDTAAARTEATVVDIGKKHPEAFERKKENDNKSNFSESNLNVKVTSEKAAVRTQAVEADNRKKHPKASEKKKEMENNKKSNFSKSNLNVGMTSEKPGVCAATIVVDPRTEEAIKELESFFNVTEVIPEDDPKVVTSKKMNNKKKKDVICISDEETDPEIQILSVQTVPQPKTTIQPKPQQRQTTPVQPITTPVPPSTTPVQPPTTPRQTPTTPRQTPTTPVQPPTTPVQPPTTPVQPPTTSLQPPTVSVEPIPQLEIIVQPENATQETQPNSKNENLVKLLQQQPAKPTINVINSDIIKNINTSDNDVNILKRVLTVAKINASMKKAPQVNLIQSPIVDGSSNRVKIFKNLRRHLEQYKIPIEVKHSPEIFVEYRPTKVPSPKKGNVIWHSAKVEQLKPTNPTPPRTDVEPQLNYTILSSQSMGALNQVIVNAQTNTAIQSTNQVQGQLVKKTNPALILPSTSSTTSNPLVFNGRLVSTSAGQVQVTTKTTSAPPQLVLNGTHTICNNTSNTNITNIILVPMQNFTSTLGACSDLPVIQNVATQNVSSSVGGRSEQPSISAVDTLRSITDALMPPSSLTSNESVKTLSEPSTSKNEKSLPAIRVKNLEELS